MNILELAAKVDAAYRYDCANAYIYPFEVEYTWCQDIMIAVVCQLKGDKDAIKNTVETAFAQWKTDFEAMRDLATALNYLAWYTNNIEEYKSMTQELCDLYYKSLDVIDNNLTEEEQAKIYRILD